MDIVWTRLTAELSISDPKGIQISEGECSNAMSLTVAGYRGSVEVLRAGTEKQDEHGNQEIERGSSRRRGKREGRGSRRGGRSVKSTENALGGGGGGARSGRDRLKDGGFWEIGPFPYHGVLNIPGCRK